MQPCNSTLLDKDGFSACKTLSYRLPPPSRDEYRTDNEYRTSENGGLIFWASFDRETWKINVEREGWESEEYEIQSLDERSSMRDLSISPDNSIIGLMVEYLGRVRIMLVRRGEGLFLTLEAGENCYGISVHNKSLCVLKRNKTLLIPYEDPMSRNTVTRAVSCYCIPEWGGVRGDFYAMLLLATTQFGDSVSVLIVRDLAGVKRSIGFNKENVLQVHPHESGLFVITQRELQSIVNVYVIDPSSGTKKIGQSATYYDRGRDCVIPIGKYTWAHASSDGVVEIYIQSMRSYAFTVGAVAGESEQYSFSYSPKCIVAHDSFGNEVSWIDIKMPAVAIAFKNGVLFDSGCYVCPGEHKFSDKHMVESFEQINVFRSQRGKELERNMHVIERLAAKLLKPALGHFVLANRHMCTEGRPFLPTEIINMVARQALVQEVAAISGK